MVFKVRPKLIYYFGYDELEPVGGELIELFDLSEDPKEMDNLHQSNKSLSNELLAILKTKLEEVNKPNK